jgi:hypothetical protein
VRGLDEEWHLHSKPLIHWKAITSINRMYTDEEQRAEGKKGKLGDEGENSIKWIKW